MKNITIICLLTTLASFPVSNTRMTELKAKITPSVQKQAENPPAQMQINFVPILKQTTNLVASALTLYLAGKAIKGLYNEATFTAPTKIEGGYSLIEAPLLKPSAPSSKEIVKAFVKSKEAVFDSLAGLSGIYVSAYLGWHALPNSVKDTLTKAFNTISAVRISLKVELKKQ